MELVAYLFFWLCQVFIALLRLSLAVASGGSSSLRYEGFSLWGLHLLLSQALGSRASVVVAPGLGSCSSQALHRLSSCGSCV